MKRVAALALAVAAVATLGACAASDTNSASKNTTTTAPVLPEGACVARMSDASPGQGGTETVIVDSHFPSVPVVAVVNYKSTKSNYSGAVNSNKHGELTFSIGKPTLGYPVTVDVAVGNVTAAATTGEKCQASFTPH